MAIPGDRSLLEKFPDPIEAFVDNQTSYLLRRADMTVLSPPYVRSLGGNDEA
jgi:hypothetical protein